MDTLFKAQVSDVDNKIDNARGHLVGHNYFGQMGFQVQIWREEKSCSSCLKFKMWFLVWELRQATGGFEKLTFLVSKVRSVLTAKIWLKRNYKFVRTSFSIAIVELLNGENYSNYISLWTEAEWTNERKQQQRAEIVQMI